MDEDTKNYLDRIRKTIADSERLVSQTKLRMAETDRMLERQGLTREQVMAMRFSEAQKEAVNAELKRRGLDPLERWEMDDVDSAIAEPYNYSTAEPTNHPGAEPSMDAEMENRQRKFGMMMKPFQI